MNWIFQFISFPHNEFNWCFFPKKFFTLFIDWFISYIGFNFSLILKTLFQSLLWYQNWFFINIRKVSDSFLIEFIRSSGSTIAILLLINILSTFVLWVLLNNTFRFDMIAVQTILFTHFRIPFKTFIPLRTSKLTFCIFIHVGFIIYIHKTSFDLIYLWNKFLAL